MHRPSDSPADAFDNELRADCDRCCGLCCVAPAFARSADFAIDKAPGTACPHLGTGFRCDIHANLRAQGFAGCVAYDCFGAGQKVTQLTFAGKDWRQTPALTASMFAVFSVMRQLHELLVHLEAALDLELAGPLHEDLRNDRDRLEALTCQTPEELLALDVTARRQHTNELLLQASELVRNSAPAAPG
jgi:hypothetical protein